MVLYKICTNRVFNYVFVDYIYFRKEKKIMAKKFTSNTSGNNMSKIMIAVIAVVLALGVFAVAGVIRDGAKKRAHEALEEKLNSFSATIGERADSMGMEFDEFLAYYGIEDADLKANDEEQKAYEQMTLKNYVKFYMGSELTESEFEAFKASAEVADDVTIDTTDAAVKTQYMLYYQEQQNAASAQDTTLDTDAIISTDTDVDVESDAEDAE